MVLCVSFLYATTLFLIIMKLFKVYISAINFYCPIYGCLSLGVVSVVTIGLVPTANCDLQ